MRPTFLFVVLTLVLAIRSFTQDAAKKPAQDSSKTSETCILQGTVYAAASGAPLKSATVTLKAEDESSHQLTDSRGRFVFTGVPPGHMNSKPARPVMFVRAIAWMMAPRKKIWCSSQAINWTKSSSGSREPASSWGA